MAASDEVDLELIGALMDGRLTGAERDRAIKLLGNSEAAFEIYADALRARADVEAGRATVGVVAVPEPSKVVPITAARSPKASVWRVAVPAAAAAVVMVAMLPILSARRDRAAFEAPVSTIASLVVPAGSPRSPEFGPRWDERDWTVYRGGASSVADTTAAFRLGVRVSDLHVALATGDPERAGRVARDILELLQAIPLSDAVRAEFTDVQGRLASGEATNEVLPRASRAAGTLDGFLGSRWFGFGKWFALGDLAARARSAQFFTASRTARFLDWAMERGRLAPSDVELLRQVAVLADNGPAGDDFETIRQKFAELIRRHGG